MVVPPPPPRLAEHLGREFLDVRGISSTRPAKVPPRQNTDHSMLPLGERGDDHAHFCSIVHIADADQRNPCNAISIPFDCKIDI